MSIHAEQDSRSSLLEERKSFRRIWITAWMVTAVFVLSNSATPLYVYWQQKINFSNGTLTLIFASYIVGLLLTLMIAGQLSDRFGRKPVIFPGITAAIIACLLFATASSVIALLTARFLSGVAVGVMVSAGMASVVDAGGAKLKQQASLAASVSMVLGAGLGPLLSSILSSVMTQPVVPLFIIQIMLLVSACFVVGTLPKRNINLLHPKNRSLHLPGVPSGNRLHLVFGITVFAPGITATSFILSLGPSLLAKVLEVTNPLVAGSTACAMFLTATGIQFALSKFSVRTIFIIGTIATILSMIGLVAAVTASSVPLFILAAIFAGMGQGLGQLGGLTLIGLHVPEHRRAEANAVLNMGGYIPAALLPVCIGFLIDGKGLAFGTIGFAVILTVLSVSALLFVYSKLSPSIGRSL